MWLHMGVVFLFLDFMYLSLERGKEGEIEGEKHQCVVTPHTTPTATYAFALTGN